MEKNTLRVNRIWHAIFKDVWNHGWAFSENAFKKRRRCIRTAVFRFVSVVTGERRVMKGPIRVKPCNSWCNSVFARRNSPRAFSLWTCFVLAAILTPGLVQYLKLLSRTEAIVFLNQLLLEYRSYFKREKKLRPSKSYLSRNAWRYQAS